MDSTASLDTAQLGINLEFLEGEALKLPPHERSRLADVLIASLDPVIDPVDQAEIDQAWIIEAERRLQEILDGTVVTIPADEVMRKLRSKFGQ